MTSLVLFTPDQPPCVRDETDPSRTVCGWPTRTGHVITDLQALVWCRNSRCHKCAPLWNHQSGKGRKT